MKRIAIGGWQHETNTFGTYQANLHAFEQADEWPPLCAGQEMIELTSPVHLPIAGAIQVLEKSECEIIPLLWCSATPCAHVTEDAFETICARLLQMIQQAMPLDGIYLDLHGAMVCEHLEDGEGEILRRIRKSVGEDIPIAVSLDLHANVTPEMVDYSNILEIFRTYPHIDMGETGARAARALVDMLENGTRLFSALEQIEFLIPLNFGCSLIEPCKSLYGDMPELIQGGVRSVSFAAGFHLSDIYHVGPAVVAYGETQQHANQAAKQMADRIRNARPQFSDKIWQPAEAINHAEKAISNGAKTLVLADTQDNPGGGGAGDTTGLLQALIEGRCESALFGAISDPEVAEQAHLHGPGAQLEINLGGKSGMAGQSPLSCHARVLALSDGRFIATGPMYKGADMQLGPCALIEIHNIHVLVCSKPVQTADQSVFLHMGIDLSNYRLIAVKSSVHFRNHYTELADEILVVAAPGVVYADPSSLNYKNIRPDLETLIS